MDGIFLWVLTCCFHVVGHFQVGSKGVNYDQLARRLWLVRFQDPIKTCRISPELIKKSFFESLKSHFLRFCHHMKEQQHESHCINFAYIQIFENLSP